MNAWFVSMLMAITSLQQVSRTPPDTTARGAYLARAGDCTGCHTVQGGQPFAGGQPIGTPIGSVISTNITPDLDTGIGRYSSDDFVKVMREGVAKDGHHLYPAMPYPSYVKLSQADLLDLYTYFMQGVEPVRQPNRATKLSWPLSVRSLMAVWNAIYLKKGEYAADSSQSSSWNRGAYMVQGLGHCGACHTPRGIAGQEKAGRHFLAGATLDNWQAYPLTGDRATGLHAWSKEEIVEFLKTGRTARVAALAVMGGVVSKSTQYLTDQDLLAMAEYLKALPPSHSGGLATADSTPTIGDSSAATSALRAGDTGMRGSRVYLDNCNACHRSDGAGASRTFANLAKNEAVNAKDPISLIHIVLSGSSMPQTKMAPTAFAMPAFGERLSDEDVAEVLTFIRENWGNHAAEVSRHQVGRVRKALAKEKAE